MKIVRFLKNKEIKYGRMEGKYVQALRGAPFPRIKPALGHYERDDIQLLSPCLPSKIVAVGLNYKAHAAEIRMPLPSEPLLFLKPSTAVIGPEENIVFPSSSRRVDYEAELGIVIGRRACGISAEEVWDYILGYTCFNDVTARDQQPPEGQWTRSKSYDSFAPIGPWIETELDPDNVHVRSYLNGQLKQSSNTNDLIFPVSELVSFISHCMTLLPGDLIAAGTPSGVGPMSPGDTIEIDVGGVGVLRNYVVASE